MKDGSQPSPPSCVTSCSLSSELFLSVHKHAVISPILEKTNKKLELPSPSNYSPISLLTVTGKKRVYLHSTSSSSTSPPFFFSLESPANQGLLRSSSPELLSSGHTRVLRGKAPQSSYSICSAATTWSPLLFPFWAPPLGLYCTYSLGDLAHSRGLQYADFSFF